MDGDITELILKFGWIGWKGDLKDLDSLFDWLYKEFGIYIEEGKFSTHLIFQGSVLCDYYGVWSKECIIQNILPDVLLLWKCEGGNLEGPSLDNFEEPNTEWT